MDLPAVGVRNGEHGRRKREYPARCPLGSQAAHGLECLQPNTLGRKGPSWAMGRTQDTELWTGTKSTSQLPTESLNEQVPHQSDTPG